MSEIREKTFAAFQAELRDIDKSLVDPGQWTNLQWELRSRATGALVESGALNPTSNPQLVAVNLESSTVQLFGPNLILEVKCTYTSALAGGSVVARCAPRQITLLKNDLISI